MSEVIDFAEIASRGDDGLQAAMDQFADEQGLTRLAWRTVEGSVMAKYIAPATREICGTLGKWPHVWPGREEVESIFRPWATVLDLGDSTLWPNGVFFTGTFGDLKVKVGNTKIDYPETPVDEFMMVERSDRA
ncbi:hypothetical protein [Amycolatopsis minnesotensis]|uniref:Uncharacterized protein n=1 Tax=Amycolatopsis minnesotensis TaxID=337894 RepID=A0ABN2RTQ1_9PSEU